MCTFWCSFSRIARLMFENSQVSHHKFTFRCALIKFAFCLHVIIPALTTAHTSPPFDRAAKTGNAKTPVRQQTTSSLATGERVDLCATRPESLPYDTLLTDLQAAAGLTQFNRIEHVVSVNATVRLECHICFDSESVYTRVWFRRRLIYLQDATYGFSTEQMDDEMRPVEAEYIVPGSGIVSTLNDDGEDVVKPVPKFQIEFGTHDLLISAFAVADQGEYHCRTHEYRTHEPDFVYFVSANLGLKPRVVHAAGDIRYGRADLIWPASLQSWLVTKYSKYKYRLVLGKISRTVITSAGTNNNKSVAEKDRDWSECNRCDAWGVKTRQWQCRIVLPQRMELMELPDGQRFVTACQFEFDGLERGVWPLVPLSHQPPGRDLQDRQWVLRGCYEAQRQLFPQFESIRADELEVDADLLHAKVNRTSLRHVTRQFRAAFYDGFACDNGRRYTLMHKLTAGTFPAAADAGGWMETQNCFVECSSLPGGGAELKNKFELEANVDLQHMKEFESSSSGDGERIPVKLTLRHLVGEDVSLTCPNTSYERMVVWMNESRALSPFTLATETQGRVVIDDISRLLIRSVDEFDDATYSCWQNEILFAKLTLKIDDADDSRRAVPADFWLAVWYLNITMMFNCTLFASLLIVMCKRYKGFVAFSTKTYDGEDVERPLKGDVDSGTTSGDEEKDYA